MKNLKYILFLIGFVFLILLLYNFVMSNKCLEECDRDEKCWSESHCGIGI